MDRGTWKATVTESDMTEATWHARTIRSDVTILGLRKML